MPTPNATPKQAPASTTPPPTQEQVDALHRELDAKQAELDALKAQAVAASQAANVATKDWVVQGESYFSHELGLVPPGTTVRLPLTGPNSTPGAGWTDPATGRSTPRRPEFIATAARIAAEKAAAEASETAAAATPAFSSTIAPRADSSPVAGK